MVGNGVFQRGIRNCYVVNEVDDLLENCSLHFVFFSITALFLDQCKYSPIIYFLKKHLGYRAQYLTIIFVEAPCIIRRHIVNDRVRDCNLYGWKRTEKINYLSGSSVLLFYTCFAPDYVYSDGCVVGQFFVAPFLSSFAPNRK